MNRKIAGLLPLCIAVALSAGCVLTPKPTTANTVTDKPNALERSVAYSSPKKTHAVVVMRTTDGQLSYSFRADPKDTGPGRGMPLGKGNDWFMSWDAQERLWVCVPGNASAICHVHYADAVANGVLTPGEVGGWEGIPQSFFDRLPETQKKICRDYLAKKAKP